MMIMMMMIIIGLRAGVYIDRFVAFACVRVRRVSGCLRVETMEMEMEIELEMEMEMEMEMEWRWRWR